MPNENWTEAVYSTMDKLHYGRVELLEAAKSENEGEAFAIDLSCVSTDTHSDLVKDGWTPEEAHFLLIVAELKLAKEGVL